MHYYYYYYYRLRPSCAYVLLFSVMDHHGRLELCIGGIYRRVYGRPGAFWCARAHAAISASACLCVCAAVAKWKMHTDRRAPPPPFAVRRLHTHMQNTTDPFASTAAADSRQIAIFFHL